jgi:hypothetical protein
MTYQIQGLHFFSEHLDWVKSQSMSEFAWSLVFKDAIGRWQFWRIHRQQVQGFASWEAWESYSTSFVLVYAPKKSWNEAEYLLHGLNFPIVTFYSFGSLHAPSLRGGIGDAWWWKGLFYYSLTNRLIGRDKFDAMEYKLKWGKMIKKTFDLYWRGWLKEFWA